MPGDPEALCNGPLRMPPDLPQLTLLHPSQAGESSRGIVLFRLFFHLGLSGACFFLPARGLWCFFLSFLFGFFVFLLSLSSVFFFIYMFFLVCVSMFLFFIMSLSSSLRFLLFLWDFLNNIVFSIMCIFCFLSLICFE